jgi:hypothetical protein
MFFPEYHHRWAFHKQEAIIMRMLRWSVLILLVCGAGLSAGQRAKTLTASREGWYTASTRYPQFEEQTPVAVTANKVLTAWATRRQEKFVKESTRALRKFGKPTANYEYTMDYEVTFAEPARLLSIRFDAFQYTGGAHGAPEYITYTFGMKKGKARRLMLGDLFKTGSAYRDTVTAAVLAKLKRNPQANLVVSGDVTSLTDDQLNRFSVESDGLMFLFNPYEVGPYSAGRFQVKLTPEELGVDFRRNLLAP